MDISTTIEENTNQNGKAIPFIIFNQQQGFSLTQEAEEFLFQLNDEALSIVTVVGKYRTGKSFFINRVLLNNQGSDSSKASGFPVGPTVNPCTKGLWIWNKAVNAEQFNNNDAANSLSTSKDDLNQQQQQQQSNQKKPKSPPKQQQQFKLSQKEKEMKVLIIDTEGFGGIDERDKNRDLRIFLLALMLSSYLIYNSVGPIDEISLQDIALIINLAKEVRLKAKSLLESEDIENYFPSLLWVLRDFSLQMTDKNGTQINAREYLENSLQLHKGISDKIEERNRVRKLIRHCFQERDCITLSRPAEKESELQEMDKMNNSSLRNKFLLEIQQARQKIFKKIKPKIVNQKVVSGRVFLHLCKCFIQTINEGQNINIEHTWEIIMKSEAQKVLKESLFQVDSIFTEQSLSQQFQLQDNKSLISQDLFKNNNQIIDSNKLTFQDFINEESLKKMKINVKKQLVEKFKKKTFGVDEEVREYVKILEEKINQKFKEFKVKNRESLLHQCEQLIITEVEQISKKINQGYYSKCDNGGLLDFYGDLNKLKQFLNQKIGDIPEKLYLVNQILCVSNEKLFKEFIQYREDIWTKQNICGKYKNESMQQQIEQWRIEKREMQEKLFKYEMENQSLTNKDTIQKETIERMKKEYKQNLKQLQEEKENSNLKHSLELKNNYQKEINDLQEENQQLKTQIDIVQKKLVEIEKDNLLKYQQQKILPNESSLLSNSNDKSENIQELPQQIQQKQDQLQLKEKQLNQNNDLNQSQQILNDKNNNKENIKILSDLDVSLTNNEKQIKQNSTKTQDSQIVIKIQNNKNSILQQDQQQDNSVWVQAIYQKVKKEMHKEMNDIIESNKNLTESLDKLEKRNTLLFQQNEQNKSLLNNTLNLQCAKCLQSFNINKFQSHIEVCRAYVLNSSRSHSQSQIAYNNNNSIATTTQQNPSMLVTVNSPSCQSNATYIQQQTNGGIENSSLLEKFKNSQMRHCSPEFQKTNNNSQLINQNNYLNQLSFSNNKNTSDQKLQIYNKNSELITQRLQSTPLRGQSNSVHIQNNNNNNANSLYQQTFSPNLLNNLGISNSSSAIKQGKLQQQNRIYSLQNTPRETIQNDKNNLNIVNNYHQEIMNINNSNKQQNQSIKSIQDNQYQQQSQQTFQNNNNQSCLNKNNNNNVQQSSLIQVNQSSTSNNKCKEELEICVICTQLQKQQSSSNNSSLITDENNTNNSCFNSNRNNNSQNQALGRLVLQYQVRTLQQIQGNFYTVWRSLKDFYDLHKSIKTLFPKIDINLEQCGPLVNDMNNNNNSESLNEVSFQQRLEELTFGDLDRNSTIEERKIMLQAYLRELSKNYLVRNSTRFRRFLGILENNSSNNRKGCDKEKLIEIKRNLQRELSQLSTSNHKTISQDISINNGNNNKILNIEPLNLLKQINNYPNNEQLPSSKYYPYQQQQPQNLKSNVIKETFKVDNNYQKASKQLFYKREQLPQQTKNNINMNRHSVAAIYNINTLLNNNNNSNINNQNSNNLANNNANFLTNRSISKQSGQKNKSVSAHYVNIFDANTLFTETLETEVEKHQQNLNFSNLSTLPNNNEQVNIYDPSFQDKSLLRIMRNSHNDKQLMKKNQGLFTIHSRNSSPKLQCQ